MQSEKNDNNEEQIAQELHNDNPSAATELMEAEEKNCMETVKENGEPDKEHVESIEESVEVDSAHAEPIKELSMEPAKDQMDQVKE